MTRINERAVFKVVLATLDTGFLASAFLLAYWARFHLPVFPTPPEADFGTYLRFSVFIGFVGFVTLYNSGMYRLKQPFFGIDDFFAVVKAVTLSHLIAAAVSFAIRGRIPGDSIETYSRIVIAVSWLLGIFILTFWRLGFDTVITALRRRGVGLTRVLILGNGHFGHSFHTLLSKNPELGYAPVGLIDETDPEIVSERLRSSPVDEVMITAGDADPSRVMTLMGACQDSRVKFSMVPTLFHMLTSQIQVREVAGVPIFALEERIFLRSSRILKRTIDLLLALGSLLVVSPLIGISAALIRLESQGPVVWRQKRIGKKARPFMIYKLRSMRKDAEVLRTELDGLNEVEGALFKIKQDPRITRIGRLIRKFSVDEVPQLINVIKGEMSVVVRVPRFHLRWIGMKAGSGSDLRCSPG